jgi:hypothetical protein
MKNREEMDLLVGRALRVAAATALDEAASDLPDPGPLWWRAERERRRRQAARALGSIRWMERLALAAGTAGGAAALAFYREALAGWLGPLLPERLPELIPELPRAAEAAAGGNLFLAGAGLLLSGIVFGLWSIWSEA